MKQLICPKCLRTQTVTANAQAACAHGKPETRFNKAAEMIPLDQLAKENA